MSNYDPRHRPPRGGPHFHVRVTEPDGTHRLGAYSSTLSGAHAEAKIEMECTPGRDAEVVTCNARACVAGDG